MVIVYLNEGNVCYLTAVHKTMKIYCMSVLV